METKINIVLVEPQIPQNTGNIARTCAVTGAALHLVRPLGFEVTDKHLKRSGLDYWGELDIRYYDGISDFFGRNEGEYYFFSTKAKRLYTDVTYPENAYIIFGREDKGLPEELLYANFERCVRLPMRGNMRSLNLSNCAAVAVFEILRQQDAPYIIDN